MRLAAFDHPFLFIFALTISVIAMTKVIAYGAGKAGLPTLQQWIRND